MYPGLKTLIPPEAFLYFPEEGETKNSFGARLIFEGRTKFDENETAMIKDFRNYTKKINYTLKPIWQDHLILRFLQANGFKLEKTLTAVKEHTNWKEIKYPIRITDPIKQFLEGGFVYVHGRDCKFRPIVVFNAYLIDMKTFDPELISDALAYLFEFIVEELLLPGQAENWIFILDLKDMSLATLPFNPLKKVLHFLQHHYRGRLYAMYVVNTPSTVYIPWQMSKKFLEEYTVNKIHFYKNQIPDPLLAHTNKEQIEERYGGTAPNVTKFWPPVFPSKNYFLSPEEMKNLISNEEYVHRYKNGKLQNFKLDKERIYTALHTFTEADERNVKHGFAVARNEMVYPSAPKKLIKTTFPNPLFKDQSQQNRNANPLETEGADFGDVDEVDYLEFNEPEIPRFESQFMIKGGHKPMH